MKKLLLVSLIFLSFLFVFGCVAKSKVSTGDNGNLERSQQGQTTQEEISKNSEELYSFTITVSDNQKLTVVLDTTQPENNYFSVSKILVYDSEQLLQTLNIPSTPPVDDYAWDGLFVNKGYDVGKPDIRDVNFDGAEDFGLLAVSAYPHNVPYSYYIWNKEKDLFEYGFTLFGAASLEVDSAGQRLIETVHDATATYEVFYHYAPNGTLFTTSTSEEEDQRLAFGKVLWDVYQRGIIPDGKLLEYHTYYSMEAAEKNSFAVTDVDGDGQDELLIFWETATMAGMCGYVFGYDGGEIYEELSAFPSLRFYDNGIVEEDASHNQNLAGDFWPYFVYQYDAKSGVYQRLGGVDAWDKRVREQNAEGEIWPVRFPTDVDLDGDNIIYFILPAYWNGYYYDVPVVDDSDYETWRNAYLNGAKELNIPLQKITEKNVAALGYPKPDVQLRQPVG